jgi:hypothetical protein
LLTGLAPDLSGPQARSRTSLQLPPRFAPTIFGQALDLAPRDAMMAARGLHRFDPALVNPLFERRIADARKFCGFMQPE